MGRKRRPPKRYRDPYGKNRPLKVGQGRCRNKVCNAAVWYATLIQYDLQCPNCNDYSRIHKITKDWEIKL